MARKKIVVTEAAWSEVELPPTGKRKTGQQVRLTNGPDAEQAAGLLESGALSEDLTIELARVVLLACVAEDDVDKLHAWLEEAPDPVMLIAMASAVRLGIVARQTRIIGGMLTDFGTEGNGKG